MRLFSYVIKRDFGFAPNPYFNICSLATCKPQIRKYAQIGDWIAGFGGKQTPVYQKLVYLMQVSEKLKFDQYWNDARFAKKKPDFLKSLKFSYGDNIYHHDIQTGNWIQENSHHSFPYRINFKNLNKDTSVDAVLVSTYYWYFGINACTIPEQFQNLIAHGRPYKCKDDLNVINDFKSWIESAYIKGINGKPFSWNDDRGFERFGGD